MNTKVPGKLYIIDDCLNPPSPMIINPRHKWLFTYIAPSFSNIKPIKKEKKLDK